jgi:hypothetical protein
MCYPKICKQFKDVSEYNIQKERNFLSSPTYQRMNLLGIDFLHDLIIAEYGPWVKSGLAQFCF